ncbi:hypothetical protein PG997_003635 [Apiospora hydei]|uniref:Uncharacterized protein n=1 Tax=Apiospora hydei TaxID=1337664 RepID=A0ABR1WZR8_9PEZI
MDVLRRPAAVTPEKTSHSFLAHAAGDPEAAIPICRTELFLSEWANDGAAGRRLDGHPWLGLCTWMELQFHFQNLDARVSQSSLITNCDVDSVDGKSRQATLDASVWLVMLCPGLAGSGERGAETTTVLLFCHGRPQSPIPIQQKSMLERSTVCAGKPQTAVQRLKTETNTKCTRRGWGGQWPDCLLPARRVWTWVRQ